MKLKTVLLLLASHTAIAVMGFMLGIYLLPILIAPPSPTEAELTMQSSSAAYTAEFSKNLKGSDGFHWGEGKVSVGTEYITFVGELAPGPDYKLYLSKEFVETEADFNRLKETMVRVGDVKTFENFSVEVPDEIDVSQYKAVIVWCETFGEFITAARYQ